MLRLRNEARALADKCGVEYDDFQLDVEDTYYFIGYWMRIDNQPRPADPERCEGWDAADAELASGVV